MNNLIELLKNLSYSIIQNDREKMKELSPKLSISLMTVFPLIISTYSREEMKEVAQDALLWPKLLEKILNVLGSEDRFNMVDTLYFETVNCIEEFRKTADKYGCVIDF